LQATHDRLCKAQTYEESIDADMAFHRELAEICGNQIAGLLLHSLSELLQASLSIGYGRVTTAQSVKQHGQVLDAVLKGDGKAAARAMERHLETAATDLALDQ